MTIAAREVLADCGVAVAMLEDEQDERRWRVLWAGAVALIRAVGHVLDKVDGESGTIKVAASAAHAKWKSGSSEDAIFRDFIEAERNNILKRYESRVHPLADVPVALELTLVHPETGEVRKVVLADVLDADLFRPMVEGYGAGEDARDVYREAIAWWEERLDEIDVIVRRSEK